MAATILPYLEIQQLGFHSKPDERDAGGFVECWVSDCEGKRWVDEHSMVARCKECGDAAYPYDVPAEMSEEFAEKAKTFRQR
jgi:hypothetical protein